MSTQSAPLRSGPTFAGAACSVRAWHSSTPANRVLHPKVVPEGQWQVGTHTRTTLSQLGYSARDHPARGVTHLAHPAARPFPTKRACAFPLAGTGSPNPSSGGYWVPVTGTARHMPQTDAVLPRLSHPGTRCGDRARALSPPLPCLMSLHGVRILRAAPLAGTRSRAHGGTPTSAPSHRHKVVRAAPRQGAGRVSLDVLLSTQRILRTVPRIHMSGADWLPRPAATQTLRGTPAHRLLPCVCDMPSGATPLRAQRRAGPLARSSTRNLTACAPHVLEGSGITLPPPPSPGGPGRVLSPDASSRLALHRGGACTSGHKARHPRWPSRVSCRPWCPSVFLVLPSLASGWFV